VHAFMFGSKQTRPHAERVGVAGSGSSMPRVLLCWLLLTAACFSALLLRFAIFCRCSVNAAAMSTTRSTMKLPSVSAAATARALSLVVKTTGGRVNASYPMCRKCTAVVIKLLPADDDTGSVPQVILFLSVHLAHRYTVPVRQGLQSTAAAAHPRRVASCMGRRQTAYSIYTIAMQSELHFGHYSP